MWLAAAAAAAPATILVPGDQPDLPTAVFYASPGDEIVLDLGVWNTNDLLVDKALTIRGQGTTTTTIVAAGANDVLQLGAPGTVTIAALAIDGKGMARPVHILSGTTAHLEGVVVSAGLAPDGHGGNVLVDVGASLELVDSEIAAGHADDGGGVYITGSAGAVTITDARFRDNAADSDGGAIYAVAPFDATRGWFCNNTAGAAGGAVYTFGAPPQIVNGTFLHNTAAFEGGAVRVFDSGATVSHGTFVDNVSDNLAGAIGFASTSAYDTMTVADSVFDRGSADALFAPTTASVTVTYTGFWNVQPWDPYNYNVVELVAYVEGPDDPFPTLDPASCPDAAIPAMDSELVDAADPYGYADVDGSTPDLGATGGPSGDPDLWADTDYDHVPAMWDCDPADQSVYPGAPELPDGLDNDCDGVTDEDPVDSADTGTLSSTGSTSATIDTTEPPTTDPPDPCAAPPVDADGDGWSADRPGCPDGRVDCDDADPTVYPGAAEIANDEVDQDCDARTVRATVGGGACGCATPTPAGAGLAGFVAVVAGSRRRRAGTGRSAASGLRGALGGPP